jgi:hypothetical protein
MLAVFEPMEQDYSPNNNLIARSSVPEEQLTAMLRRAVMDLDSSITIASQGSWTGQLGLALFPARIANTVLGAFGVLAIVSPRLASTGSLHTQWHSARARSEFAWPSVQNPVK